MGRLLALILALAACGGTPDPSRAARERLVEQIASAQHAYPVTDRAVLEALRGVPRHRFVPKELAAFAYDDRPLPIGEGQTISQPTIVAVMTQALELKPGQRVLEVGTGSGYQAAVLAELGAEVYSIEIIPELGRRAAATLKESGYGRVRVRIGDGYAGWPEAAPFDAVIVTAAPDRVPQPLLDQLKVGGRLVAPLGKDPEQVLWRLRKTPEGVERQALMGVRFVPMTGAAERAP